MIEAQVNGDDIRRVLGVLKNTDKDLVTKLRKDMRSDIKPYASQVAQAIPVQAPISGMNHGYAATRWSAVKASVSFTPGKRRKALSGESALLSIAINPSDSGSRGLYLGELAGTRSNGFTPQGSNLISVLKKRVSNPNQKGGRFAWKAFFAMKPEIVALGEKSVQAFGDEVSKVI